QSDILRYRVLHADLPVRNPSVRMEAPDNQIQLRIEQKHLLNSSEYRHLYTNTTFHVSRGGYAAAEYHTENLFLSINQIFFRFSSIFFSRKTHRKAVFTFSSNVNPIVIDFSTD